LKPPSARALNEYVAVPPGRSVAEREEPDAASNVKSSPVPVSVTLWGLSSAESVTTMAPVLVPPPVGSKVTLRVQLALTATAGPQSLVWEASPLARMLVMLRVTAPVLVRLTL